ncbi:hypothetical protein E1B28_002915 [Marasmius oreades]|uniref:Uncharacterized protein n=1 Tax=Marasmius oreades TaxID=181124 RepID=A0A9P7RJT4_9AGAR|nr:uncharacterized protein E1B28_002915 [Marasmius oreades]KAG7085349.1 hypothetical protein E1B28_002915 [Marasmius oreades]
MAERLELLLKSSPHLALLIKDLHIIEESELCIWGSWLTDDESLPFILPLLVNLERFHIANDRIYPGDIYLTHLPKPVQEAFFATWRSPKLTHIAMAGIRFVSFKDVLSVISHSSHSVRNIALCKVDGDDEVEVNGQLVILGPSSPRGIDSLTFKPCLDRRSTEFYTWLLNPEARFELSSLRKLHFYIGGESTFKKDLSFFRHILMASPSIEELHIAMNYLYGNMWTDSGPHVPVDISSIRVLHLAVDVFDCLPVLDWWCDNLTSTPALALKEFEIYTVPGYTSLCETALDSVPEWKRLDEILTSVYQDINLKIRLLSLSAGNLFVVAEDLRLGFPRLRGKGRLEVDRVDKVERWRQVDGVYWL